MSSGIGSIRPRPGPERTDMEVSSNRRCQPLCRWRRSAQMPTNPNAPSSKTLLIRNSFTAKKNGPPVRRATATIITIPIATIVGIHRYPSLPSRI